MKNISQANKALAEAKERGYFIDFNGVLYSPTGKVVKGTLDPNGYRYTGIRMGSVRSARVYFHRFQAFQKYGTRLFDEGIEVRHLNGNQADNNVNNIAIGTPTENASDKLPEIRKSAARAAAKTVRKLSEEEALKLREERKKGASYLELMDKYGIAKSTVSYIVNNKTYND